MLVHQVLPLHSCQTACYWISSQFHQNQNHTYQFLERKKRKRKKDWITILLREFILGYCVFYSMKIVNSRRPYPSPGLPDWWTSQCDTDPGRGRLLHRRTSLDTERHVTVAKKYKIYYFLSIKDGELWNAHLLSQNHGLVLNLKRSENTHLWRRLL